MTLLNTFKIQCKQDMLGQRGVVERDRGGVLDSVGLVGERPLAHKGRVKLILVALIAHVPNEMYPNTTHDYVRKSFTGMSHSRTSRDITVFGILNHWRNYCQLSASGRKFLSLCMQYELFGSLPTAGKRSFLQIFYYPCVRASVLERGREFGAQGYVSGGRGVFHLMFYFSHTGCQRITCRVK